jgi:hypothetical protein
MPDNGEVTNSPNVAAVTNRIDVGDWLLISVLAIQVAIFWIHPGSAATSLPVGWIMAFAAGMGRYPYIRDTVLLSAVTSAWKLIPGALMIFFFGLFPWIVYSRLDVLLVHGLRVFFPCAALSDIMAWALGATVGTIVFSVTAWFERLKS